MLLAGCGSSDSGHLVSGRVSYEEQPVGQGTINFRSTDGKLFGGGLGSDGSFSYRLPNGTYQVRVDAPAPIPADWKEGDPIPTGGKRLAPLKYATFGSSRLTVNITDTPESHQLILKLE